MCQATVSAGMLACCPVCPSLGYLLITSLRLLAARCCWEQWDADPAGVCLRSWRGAATSSLLSSLPAHLRGVPAPPHFQSPYLTPSHPSPADTAPVAPLQPLMAPRFLLVACWGRVSLHPLHVSPSAEGLCSPPSLPLSLFALPVNSGGKAKKY